MVWRMCWYNPLFPLKFSTELLYNDTKLLPKSEVRYIFESGAFKDLVKFHSITYEFHRFAYDLGLAESPVARIFLGKSMKNIDIWRKFH